MMHVFMLIVSTFILTIFAVTAAATSVTYNVSYGTASVLTFGAAVSKLLGMLSFFVRGFFDFLQHNFLMPRCIFFMLAIAFVLRSAPPPTLKTLGAAIAAPVKALAYILRLHLDHQVKVNGIIVALQKQVADLEEGAVLPEGLKRGMIKRETFDFTLASYENTIAELQTKITKLDSQVKTSEDAKIALQKDLDAALYNNALLEDLTNVKKQRASEKLHKLEKIRMEQIIVERTNFITELESKLSFSKTQHSNEHHDQSAYRKAHRELQGKIDTKDIEIDLRNAEINALKIEVQHKKTNIHQLEQQVIMFNNVKELLLRLVEIGNQRQQIAVVICIDYFLSCSIDVTELGIDPLQLQTYFDWAIMAIDGHSSALAPTEGLRLKGVRYPLSRSFIRDGQTFAANKLFFAQPHWSPPQHIETFSPNSTCALNNSNSASSVPAQPDASKTVFAKPTLVLSGLTSTDPLEKTSSRPAPALSGGDNTSSATSWQPSTSSAALVSSKDPPAQPDEPATNPALLFVFNPSPSTDPSPPTGAPISDAKPTASVVATGAFQAGKKPGTFGTAASASTVKDRTSSTPPGSSTSSSKPTLRSGSGTGSKEDAGAVSTSPSTSQRTSRQKKTNVVPPKLGNPLAGLNAKLGGGSRKQR